jgi:hypothetical protein
MVTKTPKVAEAALPNAQDSGRTAREPSNLALTVRAPCNV